MTFLRSFFVAGTAAAVLLVAPVAYAQGLPDTGAVGDAVEGATGGATDAAGAAASGATDTVTNTTGDVTDAVGDATGGTPDAGGTVGDAVDQATGGGGTDVGGTVGNAVGDATGGGGGGNGGDGGPVDDVTNTITNAANSLTGGGSGSNPGGHTHLDDALDDVLAGNVSDIPPDVVADLVDEAAILGLAPAAAEGWIDGKKVGSTAYENPAVLLSSLSELLEGVAGDLVGASTVTSSDVQFSSGSSSGSFIDSAGRAAIEAAKTLAFPLALAALVVGFLMVQGRIGRKDPKLALAPVDTIEETLSFE